jgi:hypothetical protein
LIAEIERKGIDWHTASRLGCFARFKLTPRSYRRDGRAGIKDLIVSELAAGLYDPTR